MNDKEKVIELFTKFGIPFSIGKWGEVICTPDGDKINGEGYLNTEFHFKKGGEFDFMDIDYND